MPRASVDGSTIVLNKPISTVVITGEERDDNEWILDDDAFDGS
jgi:hypothetical protein